MSLIITSVFNWSRLNVNNLNAFEFVSTNQVLKYINKLDCNKTSGGDIPAKIIKMAIEELTVPIIL